MGVKRIIFEQSDSSNGGCGRSHMQEQMELRQQIVYRHIKHGGQGFLSAASFIAPVIIVGMLIFMYLLLR